jgi:hypothetical protein
MVRCMVYGFAIPVDFMPQFAVERKIMPDPIDKTNPDAILDVDDEVISYILEHAHLPRVRVWDI